MDGLGHISASVIMKVAEHLGFKEPRLEVEDFMPDSILVHVWDDSLLDPHGKMTFEVRTQAPLTRPCLSDTYSCTPEERGQVKKLVAAALQEVTGLRLVG